MIELTSTPLREPRRENRAAGLFLSSILKTKRKIGARKLTPIGTGVHNDTLTKKKPCSYEHSN